MTFVLKIGFAPPRFNVPVVHRFTVPSFPDSTIQRFNASAVVPALK